VAIGFAMLTLVVFLKFIVILRGGDSR
jgi:hypothetical protein